MLRTGRGSAPVMALPRKRPANSHHPMPPEKEPEPSPLPVPGADPKSSSVRTHVAHADKVAWAQAAKAQGLPLEEWATKELKAAAKQENEPGGETK